ncbi:hypothetical protein [uncultured Cloacibacillus sp.]|uniref:hypothetical protein n=1 Tax=uncultured Cloacibacillus sp. TaxID=889794 RepID=UPI00320AA0BF
MLGNSAMIDTWGDPVYQLGEEPCILHCEFDIETTRRPAPRLPDAQRPAPRHVRLAPRR